MGKYEKQRILMTQRCVSPVIIRNPENRALRYHHYAETKNVCPWPLTGRRDLYTHTQYTELFEMIVGALTTCHTQ